MDLRSVGQRAVILQWDTKEYHTDIIAERYAAYAREVFAQIRLSYPAVPLEVFMQNGGGTGTEIISYKGKGKGSILQAEYARAQKLQLGFQNM